MSKEPSISEFEAGSRVTSTLLLQNVSSFVGRTGKPYLTLQLVDRGGQIEGRVWDDVDAILRTAKPGLPHRVDGDLSSYKGTLQLTIRKLETLAWTPELKERLMPVGPHDPEELWQRLQEELAKIENPALAGFVGALLEAPPLSTRLKAAPAAKQNHHAYLGGLLDHTLSMLELAGRFCEHYGQRYPGLVDRDLLAVGVLLHDLGKTLEYDESMGMEFTLQGRLLGHIGIAVEFLGSFAPFAALPDNTRQALLHMLLSHHGDLDKGSPVRPITPEAMFLHLVDLADSQIASLAELSANRNPDGWSEFAKNFDRRFYFGPAAKMDPAPAVSVPAAPAVPEPAAIPVAPADEPVSEDPAPAAPKPKSLF